IPKKKNTIVINTFQNNSGDKSLDYLVNNIAEGFITELNKIERYVVIEKNQIDQIDEELKRTSSGRFDYNTTVERDKLWASQYILVGSFQKENDNIWINARINNSKTGESKCSRNVSGSETELTTLLNKLANKFKSCH
ncbi:MAG: FlgO family outer membrane protein, partial [Candidatus Parabeggiatoa sp.]|nr:FlgO family outer membrane protein [Candidatus Parabeggiatoa sp.]